MLKTSVSRSSPVRPGSVSARGAGVRHRAPTAPHAEPPRRHAGRRALTPRPRRPRPPASHIRPHKKVHVTHPHAPLGSVSGTHTEIRAPSPHRRVACPVGAGVGPALTERPATPSSRRAGRGQQRPRPLGRVAAAPRLSTVNGGVSDRVRPFRIAAMAPH